MDLDVFANNVVAADSQITLFTLVSQILRCITEHRARVDLVFLADFSPPAQIGMRHHAGTPADLHAPFDHHVRSDLNSAVNLGFNIDHCGRVNTHRVALDLSARNSHKQLPKKPEISANGRAVVAPNFFNLQSVLFGIFDFVLRISPRYCRFRV